MTERDVILAFLALPAGYNIDMFGGMLGLRQLENGNYVVERDEGSQWEWEFETPEEAVDQFLRIRHNRELGHDYERV